MKLSDLEIRIQLLLDDELTAEEFAELENELLVNPEAMDLYLSYAGLDSDLMHHSSYQGNAKALSTVPVEQFLAQQHKRYIRVSMLSAAAVLMIVAVIMSFHVMSGKTDTQADFHFTPGSEFTLTHTTDEAHPVANTMVENSRLVLSHGVVELQLPHDVSAVIEAPADIILQDARTLEIDHGRAYLKVSSAEGRGFTVVTPHQRIVDLGTAFGIDCQNGKDGVELHVLEGQVRVDSLKEEKGAIINAPHAVLLDGTKIRRDTIDSSTAFIKSLPEKIELLLKEDFENGLVVNQDYEIRIDPRVIEDLAGNRFNGIGGDTTWNFSTSSAPGTVRNFSFEANIVAYGNPVLHWHEESGTKASFNTTKNLPQLIPTHGDTFLMVDGDEDHPRVFTQDTERKITAGTTYRLMVDVGSSLSTPTARGFIRLFGSDAGYQSALAETFVSSPANKWQLNQTVTFTATAAHASGQTLGIALGCNDGRMIFDNVRLIPINEVGNKTISIPQTGQDISSAEASDTTPLAITNLHPANNATGVIPGGQLTITFNKPIKLGTGRVTIYHLKDGAKTELVVGNPRLSVNGRTLTIRTPANLNDGATQMGQLAGWDSSGWVGIFNPDGKGNGYFHEDLDDRGETDGIIGAMDGPSMATINTVATNPEIQRTIGKLKANQHYSISASIGVRAENADTSSFPGYTIRLMSGDATLAELSSSTPPGPASAVHAVGFSWNSSMLPEGIQAGDPLTISISPNLTGSPGFLDLDNIRVSVIEQFGKNE